MIATGSRAGGRWVARLVVATCAIVLAAPFFAPYDPAAQDREFSFAPPVRPRFVDTEGVWHFRPFTYARSRRAGSLDEFDEDPSRRYAIRFLVRGARYRVVGPITSDWHLLGVDRPGRLFLLGTDQYGRDLLSRFLHGGRLSVSAGLLGASISLTLALLLGTIAGFFGAWADSVIMRIGELFLALPWVYLLLAVRVILPLEIDAGQAFLLLVTVMALVGWARPAVLVRGVVMAARTREYVMAARSFGASNVHVLWRHVLPHVRGVALTQAAILVPQYTLAEVTLSFFGLGVAEPTPSWGNVVAALQHYHVVASYWWMLLPAAALVPVFLLFYLLADQFHRRTAISL